MKRSTTYRLGLVLAAAVFAVANAAVDLVTASVAMAAHWLFKGSSAERAGQAAAVESQAAPKVTLLRGVAFQLRRLLRGERIEVQPRYRYCPST